MSEGKIAALLLAAGYSSRMGDFKPLLPLGPSRVIDQSIATFRSLGIEILVVTGHQQETLNPYLQEKGVTSVFNPNHANGMLTSILSGVRALSPEFEAFFLLPADIPLVRPQTVKSLLAAWEAKKGKVIYPTFQGLRGHPPLISADLGKRLADWSGFGGMQSFLSQWEHLAYDLEVMDEFILQDMDKPEDYAKITARWETHSLPTITECQWLLERCATPLPVRAHSQAVARLAMALGEELNRRDLRFNVPLLKRAALLHDVKKGTPNHAAAGAQALRDQGFPQVAELVAAHMDLAWEDGPLEEKHLLFLADKLTQGERVLPLAIRREKALARYAGDPEVEKAVTFRFQQATKIQNKCEKILGESLEQFIARWQEEPTHEQNPLSP